ncbi:alpha/beta-hydrolase [Durotheca rogersii]|uniref:alpha/beta-hydrolase n=1 Tax=Durotheca rogersii TaxID=419775 RepID=UPI00221EB879|nr:alpha/beta-hydrolase [Durotheca rogersii]KAI5858254.1 alpha/beta-hydrolase [Durotheca rogersii]
MSKTPIAPGPEDIPPLPKIRLSLAHRVDCFLRLWALKIVASIVFAVDRLFHPPPPPLRPTLVKRYPCRPGLQTRIFYPPNYKPGDLLPLYLNIHGGGFALCDPQHDDEFCVMWAKRTGMLIASLDYSKAPLYPFPAAVYDVAALANAILVDTTLPIDKSKVAIGGFSAGANLALCASQLPGLKGNLRAALTFYPIVDWSHPPDVKLSMRPYKGGPRDSLEASSYWFDWAYVSPGQNRRDPLLSPCYARKQDLPPWIYIIGAEWDMLRLESQEMIHVLAGLDGRKNKEDDFEEGTYKWTLARGCSHGFTHHFGRTAEKKRRREEKCEPIYQQAIAWVEKALRE